MTSDNIVTAIFFTSVLHESVFLPKWEKNYEQIWSNIYHQDNKQKNGWSDSVVSAQALLFFLRNRYSLIQTSTLAFV